MNHRVVIRATDVVNADGQLGPQLAPLRTYLLAAGVPILGVWGELDPSDAGDDDCRVLVIVTLIESPSPHRRDRGSHRPSWRFSPGSRWPGSSRSCRRNLARRGWKSISLVIVPTTRIGAFAQ